MNIAALNPGGRDQAMSDLKTQIQTALSGFAGGSLVTSATGLLNVLGYDSERKIQLSPNNYKGFAELFQAESSKFDPEKAKVKDWQSIDVIFQLTEDDIKKSHSLFETKKVDNTIIESYLFFALSLDGEKYTRGDLVKITREINKLTPMPAMILFKYNNCLTVAVIDRRIHKRESSKDVLEKVTLIKDINISKLHRAHIEILRDLCLEELVKKNKIDSFVSLHNAWRKTLDIKELNKSFYKKLFNWYLYAVKIVTFPNPDKLPEEVNNSINVIRLLTRLIFCWFIKEKGLIPDDLFDAQKVTEILSSVEASKAAMNKSQAIYYKAILQNLFFATLNTEMNRDNSGSRRFITDQKINGVNPDYNNFTVFRHKDLFRDPEAALKLFEDIPFLNGGLFECLDTVETNEKRNREVRYDGFSSTASKQPVVPDLLFFGQISDVDLSTEFGGGKIGKHETVTGLINILDSYKFTITENTPLEEEVALDPELLGKVFENLLASYNPETRSTARNQTGSFYTPREIVSYMVDESLKTYLAGHMAGVGSLLQEKLSVLFSHQDSTNPFSPEETDSLIVALSNARILDPACGSGAFPMGVLHRMVHLLGKLDPNNRKWKQAQIDIVEKDRQRAMELQDNSVREGALKSVEERRTYIEASFDSSHHELDYLRKLFLIENCIYGVDIQNIAVQIAKLRFFISLIVEQKKDETKQNFGILAMPNLETKFVAADSLIALERPEQLDLGSHPVEKAEFELRQVRERIFYARKYRDKKELRKQEKLKRDALERALIEGNWEKTTAHQIAAWNPFDVSGSAPFFDPEMMFSLDDGFDIVIGNPPYMQIQSFSGQPQQKAWEAQNYRTYAKTGDVYCLFYERGVNLLSQNGTLAYISSNQWMRTNYGKKLREFFATTTAPQALIDFGDHQVFESATVNTNILVIRKQSLNETRNPLLSVRIENDFKADTNLADYLAKKAVPLGDLSAESWIISTGPEYAVRKRIEEVGIPLKKWNVSIKRGIVTGRDEAFFINSKEREKLIALDPKSREIIKPILRGRDIKRYKSEFADLWIIFVPWHFPLHEDNSITGASKKAEAKFEKLYPAVFSHLLHHKDALERRNASETGIRYEWYALQRCAASYYEEFEQDKITWGNLGLSAQFAIAEKGVIINAPGSMITPASPYMLAVLNSTLSDYYIRSLGVTRSGGFLEYKPMFVENLPIPKLSAAAQHPFEILVGLVQLAKMKGLNRESALFETVIDGMVYELYFPAEIKAANCEIRKHLNNLPDIQDMVDKGQEDNALQIVERVYNDLSNPKHPVSAAIFKMDTIPAIRIIEGKQ